MTDVAAPTRNREQLDRERRERWMAKRMELVADRVFPAWTKRELAEAQLDYSGLQIRFWTRSF